MKPDPTGPSDDGDPRPLILVTLSGGGWYRQTCRLLEQFPADAYRFAYVYGRFAGNDSARRLQMPHPGTRHALPCMGQTAQHRWRWVGNVGRFTTSFVVAGRIVRRLRPAAIISVANAMSIPLFVAGRCYGARCVFLESLTRVQHLSLTGSLVYHLRLASRMYVQWPQLHQAHPRTAYVGSVV